jgi:lysophospholipase L1-like esterase
MPSPRAITVHLRTAARSVLDTGVRGVSRIRPWPTEAPDGPTNFLARGGRAADTRRVVVCVGDSITRGAASADYVALLRAGRAGHATEFVNAGIDGNLAWNVRQRLDPVIACAPDAISLLIGTNDVNATANPQMAAQYRRSQGLPRDASLPWYRENVAAILDRLLDQTDARVAVLEIPPLGERLDSEVNARVREHNEALRALAAERGITCLPLHQQLTALIPPDAHPPQYDGSEAAAVRAVLRHMALRQDWDRISADVGLNVLTDHIHLNDRAASVVAGLIEGFLDAPG